ncbi:hypothetical protein SAMN04488040_3394 [Sulfitobacter marinus]|uniref:Uncharacterized protein n=1 Tax=Sulfitobacter marinus TaxID=394264 RepID=A0A1I6VK89_9RHOB|nr:hypothetical protein [Sulfitobacter marinus]SFT14112.1 hypothetical protein SAMN04488040_3394 [Sulfitobacter marinus]
MEISLPKEIQAGLDAARMKSLRKASKLRIDVNGTQHRVLRHWKTGFSMEAETAPRVRGLVDLYDGSIHLFQCLIVAAQREGSEMQFEFKRATKVSQQPALDFVRANDAPVALIAKGTPV